MSNTRPRKPFNWLNLVFNALAIVISLVWLLPIVMGVLLALRPKKDNLGVGNPFFGSSLSFDNFQGAIEAVPWLTHYGATLIFCFGTLAIQLVFLTLAAYAFARMKFFGRDVLFGLILVQLMIPSAVLLVPNFSTIRQLNLYDTKLALMMPYLGTAFGTFLLRQTFRQIPQELEDAAKIDGCGILRTILSVYIPSSIPAYVAFSLVSLSAHWNEFLWPLIITISDENRPLTVGLAKLVRTSETGALYGQIAAGTLIVVAPLLVLFIVFQRQFINSFVRSGLK